MSEPSVEFQDDSAFADIVAIISFIIAAMVFLGSGFWVLMIPGNPQPGDPYVLGWSIGWCTLLGYLGLWFLTIVVSFGARNLPSARTKTRLRKAIAWIRLAAMLLIPPLIWLAIHVMASTS